MINFILKNGKNVGLLKKENMLKNYFCSISVSGMLWSKNHRALSAWDSKFVSTIRITEQCKENNAHALNAMYDINGYNTIQRIHTIEHNA